MDQDLTYDFDVAAPDQRAFIGIRVSRQGETVLTASFNGQRRDLTAANLFMAWASHPLQTIGVLLGIYLEGLKLLLRGFRWRSPQSAENNDSGRNEPANGAEPALIAVPAESSKMVKVPEQLAPPLP